MDELRYAVVARACMDYDWAIRYLMRPPEKRLSWKEAEAVYYVSECEIFFRSEWFKTLCDLDGEMLKRNVRKYGYVANTQKPDAERKKYDGHSGKRQPQRRKKREKRMKEFEEYEKRQKQD